MSDIKLTIPDGYFDKSLGKTLAEVARIRKRRRAVALGLAAVMVLAAGWALSLQTTQRIRAEKEYLALQSELYRVDIFYEVNQ